MTASAASSGRSPLVSPVWPPDCNLNGFFFAFLRFHNFCRGGSFQFMKHAYYLPRCLRPPLGGKWEGGLFAEAVRLTCLLASGNKAAAIGPPQGHAPRIGAGQLMCAPVITVCIQLCVYVLMHVHVCMFVHGQQPSLATATALANSQPRLRYPASALVPSSLPRCPLAGSPLGPVGQLLTTLWQDFSKLIFSLASAAVNCMCCFCCCYCCWLGFNCVFQVFN